MPDTPSFKEAVDMATSHISRILLLNCVLLYAICLANLGDATAHLALIRQQWESAGDLEAGERTGSALAFGDFDGDGFADLATGAPADPNGVPGSEIGNVVVNYGDTWGLTHVGSVYLHFNIMDNNGRFGHALATGDFDDDGFDDLAVGHPYRDYLGTLDAGAIHVYEGEAGALNTWPALSFRQEDAGGISEAYDRFGWSLVAGRFDDDEYDDLAVGAVGEDDDIGAVYVFYGSAAGLTANSSGGLTADMMGGSGFYGDHFGHSLAAADLLGTSEEDLAIGVPFSDIGASILDAGRVYVVPGGRFGLAPSSTVILSAAELGETAAVGGRFGWSLAAGHLQATTGTQDLGIGEPGYPSSGFLGAGRVLVTQLDTPQAGADSLLVLYQDDAGWSVDVAESFGFALAAGDMDNDGDDELAVGAPGENPDGLSASSGAVSVFVRQSVALTDSADTYHANDLHDGNGFASTAIGEGWELGTALAFGRCDAFARARLAAGAPGAPFRVWRKMSDLGLTAQPEAGQVHVYAPWRQVLGMQSRGAALFNCQDDLILTQRPFDPLAIASTTKTMTVYLASEAITAGQADSNLVYVVPFWVADCFEGSTNQLELATGDQWRLIDLMKVAVTESAGDACYAIADIITGQSDGWPADCNDDNSVKMPTFVDMMNDKAFELAMNDTRFTNPHGSTSGSAYGGERHHSTAYDMALLGRAAMENPLFRELVDTFGWTIQGKFYDYGFMSNLVTRNPQAVGIKPGFNGFARATGVGAAQGPVLLEPPVIATTMGTHPGRTNTNLAGLMAIAQGQCDGPGPGGILPPPPPETPYLTWIGIPADQGAPWSGAAELVPAARGEPSSDRVLIEVSRWLEADDTASLNLEISYETWRRLGPGERADFGIAPFDGHAGIRLYNTGPAATYEITMNEPPGTTLTLALDSGEIHVIPAHDAPGSSFFQMTVVNQSSVDEAQLLLNELGYGFDLELGSGGLRQPDFTAQLTRSNAGEIEFETVRVKTLGADTAPGNTVALVVRDPDTPTAVQHPEAEPGYASDDLPAPAVSLFAYPNPFNPRITIAYELDRPQQTRIGVYDLTGRHLVDVATGMSPAGRHEITWQGRDFRGRAVASGTYFVRLQTEDGLEIRKVVLVR